MGLWEKLKDALLGENIHLEERLADVGKSLNEELTRREERLDATPAEGLEFVLEDVNAANARLDALTSDSDVVVPDHKRSRVRLIGRRDVGEPAQLDTTLSWVTVEALQPLDPLAGQYNHAAWLDEQANGALGGAAFLGIAEAVATHPLVEEALHEDRDVAYVRAPTLHAEDVRLLVAAALAHRLPDSSGRRATS